MPLSQIASSSVSDQFWGNGYVVIRNLYSADEVFLASTNRSLLAVADIAGHKLLSTPGPVTQQLIELFNAYLKDYVTRRIAAAAR